MNDIEKVIEGYTDQIINALPADMKSGMGEKYIREDIVRPATRAMFMDLYTRWITKLIYGADDADA